MKKVSVVRKWKSGLATIIGLFFSSEATFAQTPNNSEITSKINTVVNNIKGPLDLIVGGLGLVGLFLVFFQYKGGKPEAKDNLIKLVIGLCVWFLAVPILKLFGLATGIN